VKESWLISDFGFAISDFVDFGFCYLFCFAVFPVAVKISVAIYCFYCRAHTHLASPLATSVRISFSVIPTCLLVEELF